VRTHVCFLRGARHLAVTHGTGERVEPGVVANLPLTPGPDQGGPVDPFDVGAGVRLLAHQFLQHRFVLMTRHDLLLGGKTAEEGRVTHQPSGRSGGPWSPRNPCCPKNRSVALPMAILLNCFLCVHRSVYTIAPSGSVHKKRCSPTDVCR